MSQQTDDVRILALEELTPPAHLIREFPCSKKIAETVSETRKRLHRIIHGTDDRLIVIVGPCSIHDPEAALEYAYKLKELRDKHMNQLEIVMRVYFEKPRTTVGWKGLINDPHMDNSFKINEGLRMARELLLNINDMGMPAATEFLDMISPQYIADMISWGAIGARTTESQVHRELSSGLSCPVGFKNGTDGNIKIAIDAIKAASHPHHFLSVTKGGCTAIVSTKGNDDCHVILRGGKKPNYDKRSIEAACKEISEAGLSAKVMVDVSHGNSLKKAENQVPVSATVCKYVTAGDMRIVGVMVESNLVPGRQDIIPGKPLTYGQSVTDACLGWDDTVTVIENLAAAAKKRQIKMRPHE